MYRIAASLLALAGPVAVLAAPPATWTTSIDAATYGGTSGTITFNDHGYIGPLGARANDFQVGAGFDASHLGQIQRIQTRDPDWLTPDAPGEILGDAGSSGGTGTQYPNANLDGTVSFYRWGYTSTAGSTFVTQVDKVGNHYAAKSDMSFALYDVFQYKVASDPVQVIDTGINFKPYPVSDAYGWCGSVLVPDPNALERMAGQLRFDVAFDVYYADQGPGGYLPPQPQLIPDFVMRSYGDFVVDVTLSSGQTLHYEGATVGNNTNPLTGELDPGFYNLVSFLGPGVIPEHVWVSADSCLDDACNVRRLNPDGTWNVQVVDEGTAGARQWTNAFAGFPFLIRADAQRTLLWVDPNGHSSVIPLPAAAWLFAPALAGLLGWIRRRSSAT